MGAPPDRNTPMQKNPFTPDIGSQRTGTPHRGQRHKDPSGTDWFFDTRPTYDWDLSNPPSGPKPVNHYFSPIPRAPEPERDPSWWQFWKSGSESNQGKGMRGSPTRAAGAPRKIIKKKAPAPVNRASGLSGVSLRGGSGRRPV